MAILPSVAVSAPGKVLFAGGFLVLDRQHTGLVFGLDARIHVWTRGWGNKDLGQKTCGVVVVSPQFLDAEWGYTVSPAVGSAKHESAAVTVKPVEHARETQTSPNKFVETTVRYVFTYLAHVVGDSIFETSVQATILADDDYYSQADSAKGQQHRGFTDFKVRLSDAHKTGLGSSAALVTSLVSALLAFYMKKQDGFDIKAPQIQRTIHNLAQAAHCAAQGKVGSGFDVAAAVYGSCLYRRFTPTILEKIGDPASAGFGERLHRCVDDLELESKWDVEVASQAVQIPESLLLVMCDVDCGSETPGMVRKVLQWRKENADDAALLWNALQQGQQELCEELRRLAEIQSVDTNFTALADVISTIRSLVREMSVKSDVPIEPPVITELLDFCTSISGVVGGVAPGAGGYDAVALLLKNDPVVLSELQEKLVGWKSQDATGAKIGNVRLLGVKQENEGLRMEDPARCQGWTSDA